MSDDKGGRARAGTVQTAEGSIALWLSLPAGVVLRVYEAEWTAQLNRLNLCRESYACSSDAIDWKAKDYDGCLGKVVA